MGSFAGRLIEKGRFLEGSLEHKFYTFIRYEAFICEVGVY